MAIDSTELSMPCSGEYPLEWEDPRRKTEKIENPPPLDVEMYLVEWEDPGREGLRIISSKFVENKPVPNEQSEIPAEVEEP